MQSFISQVRASVRYVITGGLALLGFYAAFLPDLQSAWSALGLDSDFLGAASFIALSFLIGHPIARISTLLIERFHDWYFFKRLNFDKHAADLQLISKCFDLNLDANVDRFFRDRFNLFEMNAAQVANLKHLGKMSVWHSGSPLWQFLNEREQLISIGRDTWLPFMVASIGVGYRLFEETLLSFPAIGALALGVWLMTYQALFRERTRVNEGKDILLTYYIVCCHDQMLAQPGLPVRGTQNRLADPAADAGSLVDV